MELRWESERVLDSLSEPQLEMVKERYSAIANKHKLWYMLWFAEEGSRSEMPRVETGHNILWY